MAVSARRRPRRASASSARSWLLYITLLARARLELERPQSELAEKDRIGIFVWVIRREQRLADENGIGSGKEAQRLRLVAHLRASRRQPHVGTRHHDARQRNGAH